MDRYKYDPLPPLLPYGKTPPYTRLVRLHPGHGDVQIHCSLFTVNVEEAPPYETLSYVWGAPNDNQQPYVLCNGYPVPITPNLDRALRWLRYAYHERLLWIDAICIDQENLDERARQVAYMRMVYKHSRRTVVWLGPKQPGFEQAFDMAKRLRIFRDMPSDVDTSEIHLLLGMTEDEYEIGIIYLSELLDVEYFSRIWCVQEVVASKECIAKCEDYEMDFEELLWLVAWIVEVRGQVNPEKPLLYWRGLSQLRKNYGNWNHDRPEGSVGSLLSILGATTNFKATDPRDKIFALFGISDEGLAPHLAITKVIGNDNSWKLRLIRKAVKGLADFTNDHRPVDSEDHHRPAALKPDYKKPVREIYRDFTRFILRSSPRVLDIFSHIQHTQPPGNDKHPSWVPKWNERRQTSHLASTFFLAGFCNGHFRYFANIDDNPIWGQPKDPDVLRIEGFRVDQVVKVTDVMNYSIHEEWPAEAIWRQLFNFPMFLTSENEHMRQYRNGDGLDMAFLLTVSAHPLAMVVSSLDLQNPENNFQRGENELPAYKKSSRATAAAFILANTPLDTTALPQFQLINAEAEDGEAAGFHRIAKSFSHNRRVYLTRSGYLGIGPAVMRPGDEVCVLFGGRVPFILRPIGDHHLLLGDSYLLDDHIMWGKATEAVRRGPSGDSLVKFILR